MRKVPGITLAILLVSGISRASDTTKFGVDSYVPEKFIDLEWRLNGALDLRGNSYESRYTSGYIDDTYARRTGRVSSQISYRWYTVPQYVTFTLNLSSNLDYMHREQERSESLGWGRSVSRQKSSDHRFDLFGSPRIEVGRYVAKDAFLAFAGEGDFSRYESRYHSEVYFEQYDTSGLVSRGTSRSRSSQIESRVHLAGGLTIGWGRVYSGSYAVTALEVISSLRKSGYLRRDPSWAECQALCDSIHEYRQRHYFDSRDHQLEAVRALADQLIRSGITDATSLPVLLVNDVWQYYPKNDRPFGWRVYAGPVGIWDWQRSWRYRPNYLGGSDESSQGAWGFRGTAEYFRPISLRLQGEAIADVFFVSDDWRIRRSAKHYTGYRFSGDGKYLFDSRTSAYVHLAHLQNPGPLDALPLRRTLESVSYSIRTGSGITFRATELSVGVKYRISPPTTLSLSLQEYRTTAQPDYVSTKFTESGYYFSFGVTHWLY